MISAARGQPSRLARTCSRAAGSTSHGLSASTWKPDSCSRRMVRALPPFLPARTTTSPRRSSTSRPSGSPDVLTTGRQRVGCGERRLKRSTRARKSRSSAPSRAYTYTSSAARACGTRRVRAAWKWPGSRKSSECMAAFLDAVERRLHFQDCVDVAACREACAHRVHREVGGAEIAPLPGALRPLGRAANPIGEAPLDPHGRERAPRVLHVRAHAIEGVACLVPRLKLWGPTVGDLGDPLDHGLGHAAHPYPGGAPDGERVDASSVEGMIPALERHH